MSETVKRALLSAGVVQALSLGACGGGGGAGGSGGPDYQSPREVPLVSAVEIAVADFDSDGVPDLFPADQSLDILLGNGDGTFRAVYSSAVGTPARTGAVAVGYVDADGFPDVALADAASTYARILYRQGQRVFDLGTRQVDVALADLDGDRRLDMVTANGNGTLSVLLGNGDGTFGAPQRISVAATWLEVADTGGDGIPDLVVARTVSPQESVVLVLPGRGDGTFEGPKSFPVGASVRDLAVADLDGDRVPDVITANILSDDVSVLLGRGDGTFQDARFFAAGDSPVAVAVADLDGDGVPDLLTANRGSEDVSLLLGRGDGTFHDARSVAAGAPLRDVAAADLDVDGKPDLLALTLGDPGLLVFMAR